MKFDNAIDEWEMSTLGSMCSRITTGSTPSRSVNEYFNGHIPWVKTQELLDSAIEHCEEHITELALKHTSVKLLPANTVLMAMYGATVGKLGIVKIPVTCNQACCALIPDDSVLDFRFLFYLLLQNRDGIRSLATGAAQQNLSVTTIKEYQFRFPPLHEQKAIAHILGSLDDKIDQLRKTNTVLEDMASALFKSWFVDFDPVKAKHENRPTGLPKDLDELFPDSFEDSALGPIPKGWRVGRIRDYVRISKGVSYKSSELAPSNTALVTLKSFHRGGGYRADGVKSYTGKYKPDQQVHSDDLVVAYTDVTQDALVIGKPARVIADSEYSTLVASCDVGIVRPMSEVFTTAYLYELFLTDDFQNHIYGHSSGTTVLHLSSTGVQSYETHLVPEQLMTQFSVIANDAFAQKKCNINQIRTLTNLRDTLLPKLISGELRVPDAEQMVAELGL